MLGLTELLRRKPRELSGGQRQRVALGRAIVRDPKVFLMDEPLSNLDAHLRVQMRTELRRLHQRLRATVVYVTHGQVEAMTMGDRIAVMRDGRVQQVAPPREVYERPANLFVAGFIGSPAMILLPGRLQRQGDAVGFVAGELGLELPAAVARPAADCSGREVVLGVRPEDVRVAQDGAGPRLEGVVDVVEPVGSETYLHVAAGSLRLVVRVAPDCAARPGDRVSLTLNPERMHLFDREGALLPERAAK